jgi:hypothetical protein
MSHRPKLHLAAAWLLVVMILGGGRDATRSVQADDVLAAQWARYEADAPKSILELQPFRRTQVEAAGVGGSATLVDLNPDTGVWFLLTLQVAGGNRSFHLENPRPGEQRPRLASGAGHALVLLEGLSGGEPCELWRAEAGEVHDALADAARTGLPYAPLCGGRLYLRNAVTGHRSSLERITDFLRNHVYGGEKIISFVKEEVYHDAFLQPGVEGPQGQCLAAAAGPDGPLLAATAPRADARCLLPGGLGLDVEGMVSGLAPGRWYPLRDLPDVLVSAVTPGDLAPGYLAGVAHVNRLDDVESGALVYLVAFDLARFDLHFALGTDHPRLDWSARAPDKVFDPSLPGPDGVAGPAPLIMNGLVNPLDFERTAAAFAGGFKREHGAFHSGQLSLVNHGSHYGFVQEGVILSKLQPGLATLVAMSDNRVDLKTWSQDDNATLGQVRYARQNGVPLIERDPRRGSVPGTAVDLWGAGNWSGSADKDLRTVRAGVCLQETPQRRYLVHGYFSAATPSAMARVFQAYGCSYAMALDMNALEHTYLALYVHRGGALVVEHLMQGMEQVDAHSHGTMVPRFLAVPDDRDFFYLTRKPAEDAAAPR